MARISTGAPHFPPGTKVRAFVLDGVPAEGPDEAQFEGRPAKTATVTKGQTLKIDGLKKDQWYWLVGDTEDRGRVVVRAVAK